MIWEDGRNLSVNPSNMDVYGQFIDSSDTLSGANFILDHEYEQPVPTGPLVRDDTESQKFLVGWKDGRNASLPGSPTGQSDLYANLWSGSTAPNLVVADNATPACRFIRSHTTSAGS